MEMVLNLNYGLKSICDQEEEEEEENDFLIDDIRNQRKAK